MRQILAPKERNPSTTAAMRRHDELEIRSQAGDGTSANAIINHRLGRQGTQRPAHDGEQDVIGGNHARGQSGSRCG